MTPTDPQPLIPLPRTFGCDVRVTRRRVVCFGSRSWTAATTPMTCTRCGRWTLDADAAVGPRQPSDETIPMSEQAAARFDAIMDALRHPVPTVWDCTPRESYVYQYDSYEGLDERERPATVHMLRYHVQDILVRQAREDFWWRDYLGGYAGPEKSLVRDRLQADDDEASYAWPAVPYGSPEHNARREAFGLEPITETMRFAVAGGGGNVIDNGVMNARSIRDFYLGAEEAVREARPERMTPEEYEAIAVSHSAWMERRDQQRIEREIELFGHGYGAYTNVIDDPATHVDSTASAAEIERAWSDWVRSRVLAAAPHPDGGDFPEEQEAIRMPTYPAGYVGAPNGVADIKIAGRTVGIYNHDGTPMIRNDEEG